MAFRKKAEFILTHKPDILIVQECEHPDKLKFNIGPFKPSDILWFGTNQNKGLGIFSYSNFKFKLLDIHNPEIKTVIPIEVTGRSFDFTLFAIWANNPGDRDGQYVEQVWKALHHYDTQLNSKQTILIGDFNSNTIWDRKHRAGNHSNVVKLLEEKGIFSSYHLHHNQIQGREEHPTLYMYRHKDKPYHIDYCFVPADISKKIKSVEVGSCDFWMQYSDHVPLIITLSHKK
jgi:exonuclease III